MSKYLLDTNVIISHFRNSRGTVSSQLSASGIGNSYVSSVTRAELVYGALKSNDPIRHLLLTNTFLASIPELPFDQLCANEYGEIRARLTKQGQVISSNDMMVAATAVVHNLTLVTHNTREFARIPNLQLEDWETS